ncbi:YkvI family membrane protein [Brevibacillus migulae]|uniref:YkvI family membrane protein n=1 Tax=Brevibacillus migulae TaxID=1644114 RepID=UPI00106ED311|nr:hypothetical protein [Brevibacillus migulae]
MPKPVKQILQIAFTYIGTVVGAGFASGREILQFFVQYGSSGLIGILIATFLFIWAGIQVMLIAHRIRADSYQDISIYLFGRTIGTVFNVALLTILLGTTSVMLAATGAIFRENFALSSQIGIWCAMICIFFVTQKGLSGIHSVNSLFVPLLIGFTILVFWEAQPWSSFQTATVETVKPMVWLTSPLYYVALNITLTQAVLVPIGRESSDEKTLIRGGLLGGLGIGLLLILAYASMSAHLSAVLHVEMPMIALLSGMGKSISFLFALIVLAEIFSTLIANVYGLIEQLRTYLRLSAAQICLAILAISYVVSFLGFRSLLALLYPLFGQFVVFFLLMLFWRQWTGRTRKASK